MAYDPGSTDAIIDRLEVPSPLWGTSNFAWIGWHDNHTDNCGENRCSICGLCMDHERLMVGDLSREYEYVQTHRKYPASCQDPAVFSAYKAYWCSHIKGCSYMLGPRLPNTGLWFPYAADVDSFNGGPDGKNVVYLPMHKECLHIALKSPRWDETSSTRLRALFRVLRHRFQVSWEQCLRRFPGVHDDANDDNYGILGPWGVIHTIGFQNTEGIERGYFSKQCLHFDSRGHGRYLMSDPLNIPSLTDTLLGNLESQVRHKETWKTASFRKHLYRLPNELKLLIYEYLVQDQEWPLECTRLLPPRFWKAIFNKDNPCMAWLWDLDFELVRRTDPKIHMDWELLFRKLSQKPKIADCFGEHADSDYETFRGILDHVPSGLEGRRRIWKLVEEMRVGDRSTRWELDPGLPWPEDRIRYEVVPDIAEVPAYWGSNGEPLDEEELRKL